jgi:hypothetical protein
MRYIEQQKIRAAAWKKSTDTLPAEAKVPAPYVGKDGVPGPRLYDFCIPAEYAALSLLPEVREPAIALFAELGIPWHAGTPAGPSNHLLSSQVQCVNALGQMVQEPARLKLAFGELLGIDEVLEIEPGRFLTFEYIGPKDYLHEAKNGVRIRGAHCTSVDAAFLHRGVDGVVELVLVEWKYTESYRLRAPDPKKDAERLSRYADLLMDPRGPVRSDLLSFEHLVDEPFYQLMRQQLLAHELEKDGAEGASRVRLLHVLPGGNLAYQQSLARPEHRALGSTVSEVWKKLLRHGDRFISVDSSIFLDPEITSREYVLRHAPDVVHDESELLAAFDVTSAGDLEDMLYADYEVDHDLIARADGIEFYAGRISTGLQYPFTVTELRELADELAIEDA